MGKSEVKSRLMGDLDLIKNLPAGARASSAAPKLTGGDLGIAAAASLFSHVPAADATAAAARERRHKQAEMLQVVVRKIRRDESDPAVLRQMAAELRQIAETLEARAWLVNHSEEIGT